jgi:hypothetical protein
VPKALRVETSLDGFTKFRPVQHIEDLPPKDQLYRVRERSGLNYSDVEIL